MGARGAVTVQYAAAGALTALWGASLPSIDARLDLGAARLGAVLMAVAVGALVAMPVAGRLADRWTGRRVLRIAAPGAALALTGPALAGSAGTLTVAAVGLGVLLGGLNVALSVQAVAVERAAGRPVMSTMHGTWTLGAVGGGGALAAGLRAGLDARTLLVLGAVLLAAAVTAAGRRLVQVSPPATPEPDTRRGTARPLAIAALGLIGAAAFVAEAAATDWAGFHATRVLGADTATGSLAYTLFLAAMTAVRFIGDTARSRLGVGRTVRLAGCTATAGFGLVLLAGRLPAGDLPVTGSRVGCAMAGWALAGAGIAVVWPLVTSTLGAGGGSARQLSAVTTISYGGGLIAPALIGLVASRASLPVALLIPSALVMAIAATAPAVLTRATPVPSPIPTLTPTR
ncbi:MFS transporter [Virgisporangium aurantiacum]|uniref:MFS transporter n=1 Tax=Virgisporangium aurantiacum TaxID=175570 RepID=A0A8J3Z816_9ACTN|nr:MFS transporter [Virgisporangium aurantiacum]GIJ56660.1 MFS transporter [Virgisporangium aurantiacum]